MKVKIVNIDMPFLSLLTWYNIGDIIEVEPYRHNSHKYWEKVGWSGNMGSDPNFWIMKEHTIPYIEIELSEDLFVL